MDGSMAGFRVHNQFSELTQTPVHWVSDAIQPSRPLLSPSPPAFTLSRNQGLFQWVNSLHQVASFGVSASASVIPMNIQDWFTLGWTGWISLHPRDSQEFTPTPQFKSINSSVLSFIYSPTLTSIHTIGKTIALTRLTFAGKVISLLFNMLLRLVITFLPRNKHLLISWLHHQGQCFWNQKNKVCDCFHSFPIYLPWRDRTEYHDLSFLNVEF